MKKFFTIMMLAATVAACTVEDMKEQPVEPQFYTMTVKASKSVDTKALSLSGNTLNATWAGGETVTVKEGDTPLGTLTAYVDPEDNTKATLKGNLNTAPSPSCVELTLEFNSATYGGQDGTLGYIAQNSDYAKATTTITVEGNTITGTAATFENQNAIAKFTLKNGSTELRPTVVSVTASHPTYGDLHTFTFNQINDNTYTTNGGNFLYFAMPTISGILALYGMPPYLASLVNANQIDLKVTVTFDSETYTYTKSGYPFEAGKYYDITVKMTKQYRSMDKATTNDIGKVIGANGKIYVNAAEASAAGTSAEAMIAYVGKVEEVCEHGLAISLTDVYEFQATLAQAQGDYIFPTWNSSHAVTGATWHLPTIKEWQYMLWGEVITESTSIASFQTLLAAVGEELADVNPDGVNFWTNTPGTSNTDYQTVIYHRGDFASVQETNAGNYCHVRGGLAF